MGSPSPNIDEYNQIGELAKKWAETSDGVKLQEDETFVYDKNGNITQISYSNGTKDIFTYDIADRLLSEKRQASNGSTEYENNYAYDELGNRLSIVTGATATNYQYDGANQLITDGATNFTYDEVGNMLSDKNFDYVYTATDQIKEVKNKSGKIIATYEYNADGLRTKKTTSDGIEKYVYFSGILEYVTDENNKVKYSFTSDNDGTYLGFADHTTKTPTVYHYVLNYRGDVIGIKDSNGKMVVTYSYDNFGNILNSTGNIVLGNGKLLKEENPLRYASYYYDTETALYYVKARYYNSYIGRFTTRDPISQDNLYIYAYNNPVVLIDEDGEQPKRPATARDGGGAFGGPIPRGSMGGGGGGNSKPTPKPTPKNANAKGKSQSKANTKSNTKSKPGRTGKQKKLKELANDDKLSSALRGEIKRDINEIKKGKRTTIRVPEGHNLAHKRGYEARKGYGYEYADLQTIKSHKTQHKYDRYGKGKK